MHVHSNRARTHGGAQRTANATANADADATSCGCSHSAHRRRHSFAGVNAFRRTCNATNVSNANECTTLTERCVAWRGVL